MYIAWYWMALIVVMAGYAIYYVRRERRAFRQEREALLEVIRRWREEKIPPQYEAVSESGLTRQKYVDRNERDPG